MSELVPCRECRRHVRAGSSCPFCGAEAQAGSVRAAPRASGRFAMLFAGAIGLSGCGEQASPDLAPPPEAPPVEVTPVDEPAVIARPRRPEPGPPVPAYGGPALQPVPDPGSAVSAYGGPATRGPDGL